MTNILIVEDESIVAWDIKETLEQLGHQVVDLAISGAEAIRSATASRPELVLMDIRLAGAMDGITAGNEIYDRLNIPVVYLTAHADDRTLERATQTNPFGYIVKPFQVKTLQSTIKVALQRHQIEASANLTQPGLVNTLNSIGNGIITTDRQGVVTFINPIAQELTGWHATEALGNQIGQIFRLIWESDSIAIENPCLRAIRLQQPVKSPDGCWLVAKDNSQRPIADTATPITDLHGQIVGSVVVFQNNTAQLNAQMDLQERNQDLEDFQLNLISRLQFKTAKYQQAIASDRVLDLILQQVHTVQSEIELFQLALQQLGIAIDADYCWCTLDAVQNGTGRIVCEYINPEGQTHPASSIGQEIDLVLYPDFYNHLFDRESWIDPPPEIVPKPYLDLLTPAAGLLICPIIAAHWGAADRAEQIEDWTIGEIGIVTTGKPPWTTCQARSLGELFSYAANLFQQAHPQQGANRAAVAKPLETNISSSFAWLNSLQEEFRISIADVNRTMHLSAEILQSQIRSIDVTTDNLAAIEQHQPLHSQLIANLQTLQAEWQRQFQLIDILIDIQTNGTAYQVGSLSDLQFAQWMAKIVEQCSTLARGYGQHIGSRITENLPRQLLSPFPLLELIVLELFENACKYTPVSQLIILEIDILGDRLHLSVISLGLKLSPQELELIFLPFAHNSPDFTLTSGITSAGLAVVDKLVPLFGGEISATSDLQTTRFTLTMPISSD